MIINTIINIFLNLDQQLAALVTTYGVFVYLFLFVVVFFETGIVVTPFLPGDSLIFVAGTLASQGFLNLFFLFIIFSLAAVLGDSANYWIGKYIGNRIKTGRFIKEEHLQRTQNFYHTHGGKTIILARFIPIVRTFAPFVAGVGKMDYFKFIVYNIFGGLLWVFIFLFLGFYFGTLPFVEKNLSAIILFIIALSVVPGVYSYIKRKLSKK